MNVSDVTTAHGLNLNDVKMNAYFELLYCKKYKN